MRTWCGSLAVLIAISGCASNRGAKTTDGAIPATGGSGGAHPTRYVDDRLGFEVSRPSADWQLDVTGDEETDGIATPVVLRHPDSGAQVILQVAPAIASPVEFAERLSQGMRGNPGFITSDPEPLPLADDAVGFRFSMGDRVRGRVAIRGGAEGRVLMLLGTWPSEAPEGVPASVDVVFRGVKPIRATARATGVWARMAQAEGVMRSLSAPGLSRALEPIQDFRADLRGPAARLPVVDGP